jgi:hypothetical protein
MAFNVKLTPKTPTKPAVDPAKPASSFGDKARAAGGLALGAAGAYMVGQAILNKQKNAASDFTNGTFSFPNDLDQYGAWINIEFTEYKRKSIFSSVFSNPQGGIRLPLPKGMTDKFGVKYGEQNQDPAVGAGIEGALAANDSGKGVGGILATGAAAAVAGKAASGVLSGISGLAGKVGLNASPGEILQLGGLAQNPFLTVLFQQPSFKRFSFSWKLSPTTPAESETLNTIIRKFKYHMLPGLQPGAAGTLLTYPDMAQIKFNPVDTYLYQFKNCVVENISINYAPASTPALFDGGANAPVEVDISIDFLEIEYWLKEDISSEFGTRMSKNFIGNLF